MIREKRPGSGLERLNYDTQHDAKEREILSEPVDEQMDITFCIFVSFMVKIKWHNSGHCFRISFIVNIKSHANSFIIGHGQHICSVFYQRPRLEPCSRVTLCADLSDCIFRRSLNEESFSFSTKSNQRPRIHDHVKQTFNRSCKLPNCSSVRKAMMKWLEVAVTWIRSTKSECQNKRPLREINARISYLRGC